MLFMVAFSGIAHAQDTTEIADRIQKKYESVQSFVAEFEQIQTRAVINIATHFSGRIWFRNPSLVRWETLQPEDARETIVVDKEYVWDYIEDLHTASKMPVPQLLNSKTLLRFISGRANLTEDFRVEGVWDGDEKLKKHWEGSGLLLFRLVPHQPEAGMMLAYIGVEPETYLLRRIMTVDYQGNANELQLKTIDLDAKMSEETFTFTVPEGATVNDLTQPEKEIKKATTN
jgi:outer membrane lipoprotein carrier protein